jgi:hypothetical protein
MKSGNCVKKQSALLEGAVREGKVVKRRKKEGMMKKEQLTNAKKMKGGGECNTNPVYWSLNSA